MKKAKLYRGGLKNVRGEKQLEMLTGRDENVAKKTAFKSGAQARTDPNAGRPNGPLIPSNFVAVPPRKTATKGPATL